MTSTQKVAQALIEYYYDARQVGHTKALKEGFNNTPDALFMAVTFKQTQYFVIPNDRAVTWSTVESGKLKGNRRPLVIDHHTNVLIMQNLLAEIDELTAENKRLKNDPEQLKRDEIQKRLNKGVKGK